MLAYPFICQRRTLRAATHFALLRFGPTRRCAQMLLKMLNSGVFHEINGCISTGKEANVYHAVTSAGLDLAVKARIRAPRSTAALCSLLPAYVS